MTKWCSHCRRPRKFSWWGRCLVCGRKGTASEPISPEEDRQILCNTIDALRDELATVKAERDARLAAAEADAKQAHIDYSAEHKAWLEEVQARRVAEARAEEAEWEASLFWELYTALRANAFPEEPLSREEVVRRNRLVDAALTVSPAQEATLPG